MLVVIEGPKQSGKTMLAKMLYIRSPNSSYYSFPNSNTFSGKALHEIITNDLINENNNKLQDLYLQNIIETIPKIKQDIKENKTVFVDQFYQSALIYWNDKILNREKLKEFKKQIIEPDLLVYVDVSYPVLFRRYIKSTGNDTDIINTFKEKFLKFRSYIYSKVSEPWLVVNNEFSENILAIENIIDQIKLQKRQLEVC